MGSTPFTSIPDMSDSTFPGEIDPEIAELLKDDFSSSSVPDFSDLFEEESLPEELGEGITREEDLSREAFPSIERYEQPSDPVFLRREYYSRLLSGEGELSQRLHNLLQKYLKCEDPQEKGVYRQRIISSWWDFARSLSVSYQGDIVEKRWALRFAYLLPTLVTMEQRQILSKIVRNNELGEPIHYVDEWLDLVLNGDVNPLASDEIKISRMSDKTKTKVQLEKAQGSKEANLSHLKNLFIKRDNMEADLSRQIQSIARHEPHPSIRGLKLPYTGDQKSSISRAGDILRNLARLDKDILHNIGKFNDAEKEVGKIGDKIQKMGGLNKADRGVMESEMDNIRQMAKMCVGRQGNHFPFLMKNFFFPNLDLVGTRENVMRCMDEVEQVDSGIFRRTFRQKTHRIVPHTIIVPCYGDKGICWEPFERFNRATSRGRIGIPMFPKNLKLAVIYALGDLRWNVAKEKAAHYWMEEGLTGYYYQWFSAKKMRGDVRLSFLEDYALWILKEVEGVQKLDKEVRSIFWRHIPFPQPVKDILRNRGFVYNELYKKDMNRAISDGY